MYIYIYIYICIYEQKLELNNPQELICYKTQTNHPIYSVNIYLIYFFLMYVWYIRHVSNNPQALTCPKTQTNHPTHLVNRIYFFLMYVWYIRHVLKIVIKIDNDLSENPIYSFVSFNCYACLYFANFPQV